MVFQLSSSSWFYKLGREVRTLDRKEKILLNILTWISKEREKDWKIKFYEGNLPPNPPAITTTTTIATKVFFATIIVIGITILQKLQLLYISNENQMSIFEATHLARFFSWYCLF